MSHNTLGKSRVKRSKIELDIEKVRAECKWTKARELASQISNEKSSTPLGTLYELVMAECLLENIINEKDSISVDESREIKEHIESALSSTDDGYRFEAKLLSGKFKYVQKKYQDAVNSLEALNLKNIRLEAGGSRLTKLIAEAFAIIGLSLEELSNDEHEDQIGNDVIDRIVDNLELSGDLCIFHLQEVDKSLILPTDEPEWRGLLSKIVSKAIQRSPIIDICHGRLLHGINRYRQLLRYVETESIKPLRQTLSRQLAEVLLRGVCQANYTRYALESERQSTSASMTPSSAVMWRQPARYVNDRFAPTEHNQEVVLMLLISEYLANQEAVLNRSAELAEARTSTLYNSQAVYDLLSIALSRKACFPYLSQLLQHALRFSYQEFHMWYQLALSLISGNQFFRAYLVLKECQRIDSNKPMVFLLGSALCLERLGKIDEGIQLADRSLELYKEQGNSYMIARSRLLIGRGLSLYASRSRVVESRRTFQQQAIKEFQSAAEEDPGDPICRYHLALEQAFARQLRPSLDSCLACIRLGGNGSHSLHLLALLYSATGRLQEAISVIESVLVEYPSDIGLHKTNARLKLAINGPDAALKAYHGVLEACKDLEIDVLPLSMAGVANESVTAASKLETASSTMGTSMQIEEPKLFQSEILMGLAELYLNCGMVNEANQCLESITGMNGHYQLLNLRGRILEEQGKLQEARSKYESALSVNPNHLDSLQRLGKLLNVLKQYQLSEKTLRDALTLDPNSSMTWQLVGELFTDMCSAGVERKRIDSIDNDNALRQLPSQSDDSDPTEFFDEIDGNTFNVHGHNEMVAYATRCLAVAADLELTEPIESFYILPRSVKVF